MRRKGRPMIYAPFILRLCNKKLYGLDTILDEALANGLFNDMIFSELEAKVARRRAYDAMKNYRHRKLPKEPDGFALGRNNRPIEAWYGWRWRKALPVEYGVNIKEAEMIQKPLTQKNPEHLGRRLIRGLRIIIGK